MLALKYALDSREGKVVANVPSGGSHPCSILSTRDNVLVANVRATIIMMRPVLTSF